ncbi:MAG: helix-turn-helix transcriptional regulator [Lentisphaeria bacterium]|nr:helix-turn-helix transcriptional regulator [Lentisphaeria bacterium]
MKNCRHYGTSARPDHFTEYYTLLVNEQKTPDNSRTCDLLMEILLNETSRAETETPSRVKLPELAESAKRIIDLQFADSISTSDVAAELNCDPDYLGKVFRKAAGCSVLQYINHLRCREAAFLLRSSVSSIKEIAFFCGFNDLPHFRRQFFRQYSLLPGEYRRVYRLRKTNTMNL